MSEPPASLSTATATCSITGQSHRLEDLVEFDGRLVSVEGKAVLLESLRSGENLPGELVKASMLRRGFAHFLDLYMVYLPLIFFTGFMWLDADIMRIIGPILLIGFIALPTIWTGKTAGKATMKTRVVMKDGLPVTVVGALIRTAVCLLPFIALMLYYLIVDGYMENLLGLFFLIWIVANLLVSLIDRKAHRAIHDYVAGTRVILND